MRERPAQPLDRALLVDALVDVEEGVDRRAHLDVRIDVEAALGQRDCSDAAHLRHVLRLGVARGPQELRGDRRIDRLAPADVVEVVVALERLLLRNFGDHRVDLRRRRGLADRGPEHADVELAAVGELLVGLVVLGAHAAPAGVEPRGEPHAS